MPCGANVGGKSFPFLESGLRDRVKPRRIRSLAKQVA
jgi:hypothetical protein